MPELPEVETTVRALSDYAVGQRIVASACYVPALRYPLDPHLPDRLRGQTIHAVRRRAKYFYWVLDQGFLLFHLGMSGSIHFETTPKKHDHFSCELSNHTGLSFNDPRRFGCLKWLESLDHPWLNRLGVEPLSDCFSLKYIESMLRRMKRCIKVVLMDQAIVVGVGNIYASEALFRARIHPEQRADTLSRSQWCLLITAVQSVLSEAIAAGGTTLKDFSVGETLGYFAQALAVYGREGEACHECGYAIERLVMAGRASFYCGHCQEKISIETPVL